MTLDELRERVAIKLDALQQQLKSYGLKSMSSLTLIARDPANDEMMICVSNDDDLSHAFEIVLKKDPLKGPWGRRSLCCPKCQSTDVWHDRESHEHPGTFTCRVCGNVFDG